MKIAIPMMRITKDDVAAKSFTFRLIMKLAKIHDYLFYVVGNYRGAFVVNELIRSILRTEIVPNR